MPLPKRYGIERGWPIAPGQFVAFGVMPAPTPAPTPTPVPTVYRVDFLDEGGASANLWYGASASPAWVYDAARNRVMGAVQRYNYNGGNVLKENTSIIYDPVAKVRTMGGVIMTDDSSLGSSSVGSADCHGVGVKVNTVGTIWSSFGGGHGQPIKHSISLDGGMTWAASGTIGTDLTYPHAVMVDGRLFLFARKSPGGGTYPLTLRRSTSIDPTTGAISFDGERRIIDLGNDSRVYLGKPVVVGKKIILPYTRATADDSVRRDTYHSVYDTEADTLSDLPATSVTTAANFPLLRAAADASHRTVDQTTAGTEQSNTPACWVDGEGLHTLYQGGTGGLDLLHQIRSVTGTLLVGPTQIGTVSNRYATPDIGPRPGGGVEVLYPSNDGAVLDMETGNPFTHGGNIYRVERPAGGTWSARQLIKACTPVHPFDGVCRVANGPETFRFAFYERAIDDLNFSTGGNCRTYGWGSEGIVTTPFVETAATKAHRGDAPYQDADLVILQTAVEGFARSGWTEFKGDLTHLEAEPFEAVARKNLIGRYPALTDTAPGNTHIPYQGLKGSASSRFGTGFFPGSDQNKKLALTSVMMFSTRFEDVGSASWDIGNTDTAATLLFSCKSASGNLQARLNDATTTVKAVGTSRIAAMAQRINTTAKRLYARTVAANVTPGTVNATALPTGEVLYGGNTTSFTGATNVISGMGGAMGDPGPVFQAHKRYIFERAGIS